MKKKQHLVIEAIDEVLSLLREKLIGKTDNIEKAELWKKIDAVLDERLRLMKLRDSGEL